VNWITVAGLVGLSLVVSAVAISAANIRFRRLEPEIPPAPEGPRLVGADGTVVPLELVYAGKDHEGAHVWEATAVWRRIVPGGSLSHLQVDRLPAHTAIRVSIEHDP